MIVELDKCGVSGWKRTCLSGRRRSSSCLLSSPLRTLPESDRSSLRTTGLGPMSRCIFSRRSCRRPLGFPAKTGPGLVGFRSHGSRGGEVCGTRHVVGTRGGLDVDGRGSSLSPLGGSILGDAFALGGLCDLGGVRTRFFAEVFALDGRSFR